MKNKKMIGIALVALGIYRYYVESPSGATSSLGTNSLTPYLDTGGGPGDHTYTYVILAAGAYLWYKHRG